MKHKHSFELDFEFIKGNLEVVGTIDDDDYSFDIDNVRLHIKDHVTDLTPTFLSKANVSLRMALVHQIELQFDLQDELSELLEAKKDHEANERISEPA